MDNDIQKLIKKIEQDLTFSNYQKEMLKSYITQAYLIGKIEVLKKEIKKKITKL